MSAIEGTEIQTAAREYIVCALWATTGDDGEPLDGSYDVSDVSPELAASVEADVSGFYVENATDLAGLSAEQVGHDLFLTRNGHGAGFWDRGLGAIGDRLTDAAHALGTSEWYIGDDGKLYA